MQNLNISTSIPDGKLPHKIGLPFKPKNCHVMLIQLNLRSNKIEVKALFSLPVFLLLVYEIFKLGESYFVPLETSHERNGTSTIRKSNYCITLFRQPCAAPEIFIKSNDTQNCSILSNFN